MRYLTFALGKGRLANKTLEMFEKIGITCEQMKDKDTRKLIFVDVYKRQDPDSIAVYGAPRLGFLVTGGDVYKRQVLSWSGRTTV